MRSHTSRFCSYAVRCPSRRALPIISGAVHMWCAACHVMRCTSGPARRSRNAPAIRHGLDASLSGFPCCCPGRLQRCGRARLPAVPIEPSRRSALAAVAPHRVRIRSERTSTDSPWEIGRSRLAKDSNGYNVDAFRNPSNLEFDDW